VRPRAPLPVVQPQPLALRPIQGEKHLVRKEEMELGEDGEEGKILEELVDQMVDQVVEQLEDFDSYSKDRL